MSRLNVLRKELLVNGHTQRLHMMSEKLGADHPAVLKQSKRLWRLILSGEVGAANYGIC